MQLDSQQLLRKLEKITTLRPLPDRDFVDAYIKAYYLPESALELWIEQHREYSNRQKIGLLNAVVHVSKRTRQRLIAQLEEEMNFSAGGVPTQSSA